MVIPSETNKGGNQVFRFPRSQLGAFTFYSAGIFREDFILRTFMTFKLQK